MEKEIRSYQIEFRACDNKRVEGRAIPFNVFSPNREGFREMIEPSAVEGVLEGSDIFMLYNHDKSKGFLARSKKGKGSLEIDVREDGVYFSFPIKNDNLSNYVYERLANGELDEMSWAFTVAEDRWVKGDNGVYDRYISKFDGVYDFSIVDQSYYGIENAVGCKRFAEIQEEDRKALEAAKAEEERREAEEKERQEKEQQEKLDKIYADLRKEYEAYLK